MNFFSTNLKSQINKQKGFTLTELLLYMGLLIILITILSQVFASILDVRLESKSTSSVELDSKFIITKLIYDMNAMQTNPPTNDNITAPSAPGQISSTLNFNVNSINYNYSLNNGNLQLENDKGVNKLNSADTTISGLQFTRIGAGTNRDNIQINFSITSKAKRNAVPETRNYQTTISSQ